MKSLVAVSGGPDSMALVSYLEENNVDYVVCHVNYKHRPTADRDEKIVRDWCTNHNRPIEVLYPTYTKGNFEAWAREVRYDFFKGMAKKWNAKDLFVGHHQGDLLETWFMQKERGNVVEHYGLRAENPWKELTIHRPLLSKTKKGLEEYCNTKGIEWGLDETNLSDDYTRNKIRHTLIEPSTPEQRQEWLRQIDIDNANLAKTRKQVNDLLKTNSVNSVLNNDLGWLALETLLYNKTQTHYTKKSMMDCIRNLKDSSKCQIKGISIQVSKDQFIFEPEDWQPIIINNMKELKNIKGMTLLFTVENTGKEIEAFYVSEDSFPLEIRPARPDDVITMRYGTKKVMKLLRDKKIPQILRKQYPVISNKEGILFVAGSGCSVANYKKGVKVFLRSVDKT